MASISAFTVNTHYSGSKFVIIGKLVANLSAASSFHHMSHNPIIRMLLASLTALIFIASKAPYSPIMSCYRGVCFCMYAATRQ